MKVLDLQCENGHGFEGWFASEDDYVSQNGRRLVQCPICGSATVVKCLSAPRLNLSGARAPGEALDAASHGGPPVMTARAADAAAMPQAMAAAWMAMAREVLANTTDVGRSFAEEARKMHYGETEQRNIRGQSSLEETRALIEEGIEILPLVLPPGMKETLQ